MKNRIVSLFLAATMVLSLCPVSIRAEAASADTAQVQEAPETEAEQSSPVDEEPVITGTGSEEELQFEGVVYFMDEGKGVKESHRFIFEGGEGTFLIPLTTSPWWSYSDQIQSMMIDFISSSLPGKQISMTLEFETLKESEG